MLQEHIGTVDQAPVVADGEQSHIAYFQLIALSGNGIVHADHDVTIVDPVLGAPHDGHGRSGGTTISRKLPLDQLDSLQQLPCWLRIRNNIDAAVCAKGEGQAVGRKAVDGLPHGSGIRCGRHRNVDTDPREYHCQAEK